MTLRGMSDVRLDIQKLIRKLVENCEIHSNEYREARKGWEESVAEELMEAACEARDGEAFKTYFNLPEPEDHTEDYDQAIEMLEASEDKEVLLTCHEFNQYWRDEWNWSGSHKMSTANYSSTR